MSGGKISARAGALAVSSRQILFKQLEGFEGPFNEVALFYCSVL
jgi:hypothetical protein